MLEREQWSLRLYEILRIKSYWWKSCTWEATLTWEIIGKNPSWLPLLRISSKNLSSLVLSESCLPENTTQNPILFADPPAHRRFLRRLLRSQATGGALFGPEAEKEGMTRRGFEFSPPQKRVPLIIFVTFLENFGGLMACFFMTRTWVYGVLIVVMIDILEPYLVEVTVSRQDIDRNKLLRHNQKWPHNFHRNLRHVRCN